MSSKFSHLEPREIWQHFEALNAIPRASKREEQIIAFMLQFGAELHLDTQRDSIGNVLIRKPASSGYENRPIVVLQAHLDMVHQQDDATGFDFENEGIAMILDGDWIRAKGTTLGADNGLGVAAIMAVLASKTIAHPAIEALFTVDEETGMSGAKALSPDWLKGSVLLNLDTEEDDELGVGCAGGIDVTAIGSYIPESLALGCEGLRVHVGGLKGGHSGMDIHLGLANANKLLARLLYSCSQHVDFSVGSFSGGNLRNAIPREAVAVLGIDPRHKMKFIAQLEATRSVICEEFAAVDPDITVQVTACTAPEEVFPLCAQEKLIQCLYSVPSGVAYMSAAYPGQTETSNNLAVVRAFDGEIRIGCLTRSSRTSRKLDLVAGLTAVFALAGYSTQTSGDYPGWQPNAQSGILALVRSRYLSLFGSSPRVLAGHGGLECGIIGSHYPNLDMISIGPTILGAHSPEERASIPSTQKFWKLLLDILENIE